jgi:alpha-galactosidase
MGWNNWAAFKCDVNAELLEGTAQRMVVLGLSDIGYQYVVLDDCWSMGREFLASKVKFPKGMKDMARLLHSMGLLFGMYSSAGRRTCAGYE